jgi:uncharacterized membrane protein YkoI
MSKKKMIGVLLITAAVLGAGMFGLRAGMFSAPVVNAGNGVSVTAPKVTANNPVTASEGQPNKDSGKDIQNPSYAGSIKVADKDSASESTEASTYAKMAKITPAQATKAALAKVPGTISNKVVLDNENGILVYSVQVKDKSGAIRDIKIDAGNGKVLFAGKAGGEDSESESSKEAGSEEKHAKESDTDTTELQQGGQSGSQTDTP